MTLKSCRTFGFHPRFPENYFSSWDSMYLIALSFSDFDDQLSQDMVCFARTRDSFQAALMHSKQQWFEQTSSMDSVQRLLWLFSRHVIIPPETCQELKSKGDSFLQNPQLFQTELQSMYPELVDLKPCPIFFTNAEWLQFLSKLSLQLTGPTIEV